MAQTSYDASFNPTVSKQTQVLQTLVNLRLALGSGLVLGPLIFFFGVSWDFQWHTFIGRDRTLIAPHEMMLLGVIIAGLAALALVVVETLWRRRTSALTSYSTAFAGGFSGPLGAYIAGFGALDTALGFVLDSYWHALYGVDTPVLSPFHVMLLVGVVVSGLGAAYVLSGVARLAEKAGLPTKVRAGYLGASFAFSSILTILALLTIEGVTDKTAGILNLFPLLAGLGCTWVLIAAVRAIPWRKAATVVSAITLLLIVLMAVFVPVAMNVLMAAEHLSYRDHISNDFDPQMAELAFLWPLTTAFLSAFLIDLSIVKAQRKGWSQRKLMLRLILVSLPICVPVMPIFPISFLLLFYPLGIGVLLSFALGVLGVITGVWAGQITGKAIEAGR